MKVPWWIGAVLVGCTLVTGGAPAWADHCTEAAMQELLIDERDLPRDYALDRQTSGFVNRPEVLGRSFTADEQALAEGLHCAYVLRWVDRRAGTQVSALVIEARSKATGGLVFRGAIDRGEELDPVGFEVPGVKGARGFDFLLLDTQTNEVLAEQALVSFRRGRFVFSVVVTSETSDPALASELAARQAEKAPSGPSGAGEETNAETVLGGIAGSLMGFTVLYLLGVTVIARMRDNATTRGARPPAATAEGVIDVDAKVGRGQRAERLRFAAQIVGLSLLLPAIIPAFWPSSLLMAAAGAALGVVLPWWLRARERRRAGAPESPAQRLFTGRHTGRAGFYVSAASLALLAAAFCAVMGGLVQARGEGTLVPSESGNDTEIDPIVVSLPAIVLAGVLAAGGVRLYRRGRRLAAYDAKALMKEDERPIVLYLRSFTDDDVKIRTAVTTRRSLIEQLSPRRFDRFEEVLAWELNRVGPVVALNPPGTSLSPIGAARTTLGNDEWQATISQWMEEAALIVVNAPPAQATEGLRWELQQIRDNGLWRKTLFVCPPVVGNELRRRWAEFLPLLSDLGIEAPDIPDDAGRVLAARLEKEAWRVAVASRFTERTYIAALRELVAAQAPRAVVAEPKPL